MDLTGFSEDGYRQIINAFREFASRLDNIVEVTFIPISALNGDNVVEKSANTPWYAGPTSATGKPARSFSSTPVPTKRSRPA